MIDNKIVGNRVSELRKNNNMTQFQLAELLNLSESSIQKIEQGVNRITIDNVSLIANKFNVTYDWLLGASETNAKNKLQIIDSIADVMSLNANARTIEINNTYYNYLRSVTELMGMKLTSTALSSEFFDDGLSNLAIQCNLDLYESKGTMIKYKLITENEYDEWLKYKEDTGL